MALTKVTYGLLSADTSAIDLNIDANTLYVDSSANKVGIQTNSPSLALEVNDTSNVDGEQISIKGHANYGGTVVFRRGDSFNWRVGVGGGSSTNSTIPSSYFGFEQGNTASMVIAHTTGYVGIGTTSPTSKLHVAHGNQALGFDSGIFSSANPSNYTVGRGAGITMQNADVYTGGIYGIREANDWTGALAFYTHTSSSGNTFGTTFTEKMRITNDGKVGIGTTAPDFALHVKHATTNVAARFESGDNQVWIDLHDDGSGSYGALLGHDSDAGNLFMVADSNVSTKFIIKDGGNAYFSNNVGIGTSSPSSLLHVSSASSPHLKLQDTTNNCIASIYSQDSNAFYGTTSNHNILIGTNNTEAIRINNSQQVGIGTSSPSSAKLVVSGAKTQSGGAPIGNVLIADSTSLAANVGGGITFQGVYQSGGNITGLASIEAMKETATHNEYGGSLVFKAREDQGAMNEIARFTSHGNLKFAKKSTNFESPGFTYHTNNFLYLRGGSAGLILADDSSINTVQIVDGSSGYINFETGNGTSRMRIDSSGGIGFGTTSPSSYGGGNFEFKDTSTNQTGVRVTAATKSAEIGVDNSGGYLQTVTDGGGWTFYTSNGGIANTTAMKILSNGNVGIGSNASPAQALEVYRNSSSSSSGNYAALSLRNDHAAGYMVLHFNEGNSQVWDLLVQNGVDALQFRRQGTETMRLAADGSVLVNTTVDSDNQIMRIRQGGSNADPVLSLDSDTGDQSYYRYMKFYRKGQTSSVAKLDIDWSGSSIGLAFTSDARLKTVTGEADGLELITRLNPVKYVWKSEPDRHGAQGFLAQEVEQAYYETGNSHARGVSRPVDGEEHYMLDDTTLIPNLVKAIKELKDENDALKARVEALES
jgi:hypothetical protein